MHRVTPKAKLIDEILRIEDIIDNVANNLTDEEIARLKEKALKLKKQLYELMSKPMPRVSNWAR